MIAFADFAAWPPARKRDSWVVLTGCWVLRWVGSRSLFRNVSLRSLHVFCVFVWISLCFDCVLFSPPTRPNVLGEGDFCVCVRLCWTYSKNTCGKHYHHQIHENCRRTREKIFEGQQLWFERVSLAKWYWPTELWMQVSGNCVAHLSNHDFPEYIRKHVYVRRNACAGPEGK